MRDRPPPQGILLAQSAGTSPALAQALHALQIPCHPIVVTDIKPLEPINQNQSLGLKPDLLIFLSQNAVRHGHSVLARFREVPTIGVGPATSELLSSFNRRPLTIPSLYSSEGLIDVLKNYASSTQLGLVCGKHGRDLLQIQAQRLGMTVQRFEVYERVRAVVPADELSLIRQSITTGLLKVVTATSVHILNDAISLINDSHHSLQSLHVVCFSERIDAAARSLGFTNTTAVQQSDINHLVPAIRDAWQSLAN